MRPWLPNLSKFCHPSSEPDSFEKVAKTKQVIDSLIDFTVKEPSVCFNEKKKSLTKVFF